MGHPGSPSAKRREPEGPQASSGLSQGLSRRQRLTRTSQFAEAYSQGKKWFGSYMVLWLREGEDASLRLGVVASRKVGNAVKRARAKRLLREAYRRNRYQFDGDQDVVLVARRAILTAKWDDIVNELMDLARRAGLLEGEGEQP